MAENVPPAAANKGVEVASRESTGSAAVTLTEGRCGRSESEK